jgi:hypothetical protein
MPQRWQGTSVPLPWPAPRDSQFWHIMSPPASNSSSIAPQRMQFAMLMDCSPSFKVFLLYGDGIFRKAIKCRNLAKNDLLSLF